MTPTATPERAGAGRAQHRDRGGVKAYDFRRPTKLSREHVRTLTMSFETFARQYTTLLTSTLRVVAQVNLASIEQLTYDEYVGGLANPTFLGIVSIEPLPGNAVVEFSLPTAMTSVDHLLGGPGGPQPSRPMTEIESTLLRGLLDRVLREFAYAFQSLGRLEPKLTSWEYNPQFAQAAAASETVVIATFEMKVGSEECTATLCLPFASILPLLEAATAQGRSERDRAARAEAATAVATRLEDVAVEVSVRFDGVALTPGQILGLAEGDVVPLGHAVDRPLSVTAAEVTFAHATPGNQGKRLACLVVPPPEEPSA